MAANDGRTARLDSTCLYIFICSCVESSTYDYFELVKRRNGEDDACALGRLRWALYWE